MTDKIMSFKSNLRDILNASPESAPLFGSITIEELEKRLKKDDLPFVYLRLRDALWLFSKNLNALAIMSIIITIENVMRVKLLSIRPDQERNRIEQLNLSQLNRELKESVSDETYQTALELDKLRILILHNNMAFGERQIDDPEVHSLFEHVELSPEARHEIARGHVNNDLFFKNDGGADIFIRSVKILKELDPKISQIGGALDHLVEMDIAVRMLASEQTDTHSPYR